MATTSNLVTNNPAGNALNTKMNPPAFNLSPQFKMRAPALSNSLKPSVAPITPPITPQVKSSVQTATPSLSTPNANGSYSGGSTMPTLGTSGTPLVNIKPVQPLVNTSGQSSTSGPVNSQGTYTDPSTGINYAPSTTATPVTPTNVPPADASGNVSYPGVVNTLANSGNSGYNQASTGYNQGLVNTGQSNAALGANAQNIAQTAGNKIAQVGQDAGGYEGGALTTGFTGAAQGNALAIQNSASAQQQAIAQGANMALSGNAQALTGASQEASAYNSAAGNANTQQSNTQSALSNAAGYTAPILGSYGQNNYNPIGGNSSGAITGVPATDIANFSTAVANGSMSYQQAMSQLGGYGTAVANELLPSIQKINPNFNINTNAANSSSSGDIQGKINTIDTESPVLDATLSSLQSYAQAGGADANSPILSALQQKFGTSFASNPAASGLLAKISSANSLYTQITGNPGPIDPSKNTISQLATLEASMQQDVKNARIGAASELSKLSSGGGTATDPLGILN